MKVNCPYCGKPMEKGFVMTHPLYAMFWLPETADRVPRLIDRESVQEEQNGMLLAPGGQILKKEYPWKRIVTAKEMYVCRECGKGVVDLK